MANKNDISSLKTEFDELIGQCRNFKFEKEVNLEEYRQKLAKEAIAFRKLREGFHDQWEQKMRVIRLSDSLPERTLNKEANASNSEESLTNTQNIKDIEEKYLDSDTDNVDVLTNIHTQIRTARRNSYKNQHDMRKRTLTSIEKIYSKTASILGKKNVDLSLHAERE